MKAYYTYDAIDIALFLLKKGKEKGITFTNLQLQKLTYICHAFSLSYLDRPLIIEDVNAWQYGPVIPSIYFYFKEHGSRPIVTKEARMVLLDKDSAELISNVIEKFGSFTGPELVRYTHKEGTPWSKVWDGTPNKIIPNELIKAHYNEIKRTGQILSL